VILGLITTLYLMDDTCETPRYFLPRASARKMGNSNRIRRLEDAWHRILERNLSLMKRTKKDKTIYAKRLAAMKKRFLSRMKELKVEALYISKP